MSGKPVFLIALFAFLICFSMVAFSEEYPEVMFILDSSGSMSEQVDGRPKIDIAKEVMEKVVPELPPEVRVGLIAYGHRYFRDCKDIQVIIPPGSSDRAILLEKVMAIEPKGQTPISRSIEIAVESIKDRKGETTIVLVSDGIETCGGDPCNTVKLLKQKNINFIIHVVGYDVDAKAQEQLSCIAKAGGGRYFAADNADSLLKSLESVNKEVAQKVEKASAKVAKGKTSLGKLRINIPEAALVSLRGVSIVRASDGKEVKKAELSLSDSTHPLMSGEYTISLLFSNSNYKPDSVVSLGNVEIKGGETTDVRLGSIVFNVAEELIDLNLDAVRVDDAENNGIYVTIESYGNGYYLFKPKPCPAGTYNISLLYYRTEEYMPIASGVSVRAGAESVVTIDSGIILEKPEGSSLEGWDLMKEGETGPFLKVRRGWDNQEPMWRRFLVPPGKYDLYLHLKDMDEPLLVGEGIEVKKGELLKFNTGL